MENGRIPKKFWAEAICFVVLLNKPITKAVKEKTLEKYWFGRKPKINHLKVFGSLAYA